MLTLVTQSKTDKTKELLELLECVETRAIYNIKIQQNLKLVLIKISIIIVVKCFVV